MIPTSDNDKKKILNITIEEKPTGEISVSAGTGTSVVHLALVKENNFLGKNIQ